MAEISGIIMEALDLGTALDPETVADEMTGVAAAVVGMMTIGMVDHPVLVVTAGVRAVIATVTEEMTIAAGVVVAAPPDGENFVSS